MTARRGPPNRARTSLGDGDRLLAPVRRASGKQLGQLAQSGARGGVRERSDEDAARDAFRLSAEYQGLDPLLVRAAQAELVEAGARGSGGQATTAHGALEGEHLARREGDLRRASALKRGGRRLARPGRGRSAFAAWADYRPEARAWLTAALALCARIAPSDRAWAWAAASTSVQARASAVSSLLSACAAVASSPGPAEIAARAGSRCPHRAPIAGGEPAQGGSGRRPVRPGSRPRRERRARRCYPGRPRLCHAASALHRRMRSTRKTARWRGPGGSPAHRAAPSRGPASSRSSELRRFSGRRSV